MPFFTFVVPIYNTEIYLRECLLSLKNQTIQDFEVIVINDGSPNKNNFPENSRQIFDQIADTRFRYLDQPNSGVSVARNLGLSLAKGEWICFVDSDDFVEDLFLEKTLKVIKNGQNPCNQVDTFQDQDFSKITPWAKFSKFVPVVNNLTNSLVFSNHINVGSMVFCKKYAKIPFPLIHGGEDVIFGWRYMMALPDQDTIFVNSGAKYYYRQHKDQHTKSENIEVLQFAAISEFLKISTHRIKSLRDKILAHLFILRFNLYIERIQAYSKRKKIFLGLITKFLTVISLGLGGVKKAK